MSSDHSNLKQEIVERVKSMVFLCIYCTTETPHDSISNRF